MRRRRRRRSLARDRRAPRRPAPAPPAVAQRGRADAALGADVGDRPVGVLVFVADLRPGFGAEFGHDGSLSLRDCPDLRSSPRKSAKRVLRNKRGPGPEAPSQKPWIPACAGMSGDFCAREIAPVRSCESRHLGADRRPNCRGCAFASGGAVRCQGICSRGARPPAPWRPGERGRRRRLR